MRVLIAEDSAVVNQSSTEALLELIGDRFACVETRLLTLEDQACRFLDLEREVRQLGEAASSGGHKRIRSFWRRLLRLFQGGNHGTSQEQSPLNSL
jgi:hypothetical protein